MIPDTPNIPTPDELECAAIIVIAAWRNGLPVVGDDAPKLEPEYIPHPLCRAVWRGIRLHEPLPAHRHPHNVMVYAKELEPATDSEWEVLWKRVEERRPGVDEAEFRKCAQQLIEHGQALHQAELDRELEAQGWGKEDGKKGGETDAMSLRGAEAHAEQEPGDEVGTSEASGDPAKGGAISNNDQDGRRAVPEDRDCHVAGSGLSSRTLAPRNDNAPQSAPTDTSPNANEHAQQHDDAHGHLGLPVRLGAPASARAEGVEQDSPTRHSVPPSPNASEQSEAANMGNDQHSEQSNGDNGHLGREGVGYDVAEFYRRELPHAERTDAREQLPFPGISPYSTPELYPTDAERVSMFLAWQLLGRKTTDFGGLEPRHFPLHREQEAWRACIALDDQPSHEPAAVAEFLKRTSHLEDADWDHYIPHLFNSEVGDLLKADFYAWSIIEKWKRRTEAQAMSERFEQLRDLSQPLADGAPMPGLPTRFDVKELDELGEEDEPVEWAIVGLIKAGDVVMIYGESGAKKSWALLTMLFAQSTGHHWCRFQCVTGPSLYIDEDAGKGPLERRLRAIRRGYGDKSCGPLKYMSMQSLNLASKEDQRQFERLVARLRPKLIGVDTFAATAPGDENLRKDMQPILSFLRYIANKYHCAIVLIHHANRLGEYRGSTAIKASLDLLVEVRSKQGSDRVDFETEKVRDGAPLKWSARAVWDGNTFRLEPAEWKEEAGEAALSPLRQWILDYLKEHGESSKPDLVKAAGKLYSEIGIRKALKALEEEGRIRRTNTRASNGNTTVYYELSASEEE